MWKEKEKQKDMDIRDLKNMSIEDRRNLRREIIETCMVREIEPPIPDVPFVSVVFCKQREGWVPYTRYACDIDAKTTVKFIECIGNAADALNEKGSDA